MSNEKIIRTVNINVGRVIVKAERGGAYEQPSISLLFVGSVDFSSAGRDNDPEIFYTATECAKHTLNSMFSNGGVIFDDKGLGFPTDRITHIDVGKEAEFYVKCELVRTERFVQTTFFGPKKVKYKYTWREVDTDEKVID